MSLPPHLSQLAIDVTQKAATEQPFSKNYETFSKQKDGSYLCTVCQEMLFPAEAKFDAKCGWPAFWKGQNMKELPDNSGGRQRIEVQCSKCSAHLGHKFVGEDFGNPENVRYCINAVSIIHKDKDGNNIIFE